MLAVNGKVRGSYVHLPVCNLQTVKSTKKVSRLLKSPLWEQLLPNTCLSKSSSSLTRCPTSTKSWVGVYEDRSSSWQVSWHSKRPTAKWKQIFPSACLSLTLFSPSKSGVGVYEYRGVILTTGQPCLSLNPFPTLTAPIPVVW